MELTLRVPFSPKFLLAEFRGDVPNGVTITVPPIRQERGAFLNHIPWVEISVVIGAVANAIFVADYLWKKFGAGKKPVEKVTLNHREEIKWTRDSLTHVIEEHTEKEREIASGKSD